MERAPSSEPGGRPGSSRRPATRTSGGGSATSSSSSGSPNGTWSRRPSPTRGTTAAPSARRWWRAAPSSSDQLARALADRNGLDYVDLNVFDVDKGAANLVSATEARRFRAIPVAFLDSGTILVATSNPANVLGFDDIAMATGYKVRPAVASPEDIEAVISQLSNLEESVQEVEEETRDDLGAQVIELRESAEEAPVVKLVHSIIADAVSRGASDIHFDPRDGDMRVRFRVDGVVVDSATVPRRLAPGLVSRIKIMAELDIAERRAPQDGRVGLTVDGRYVDIRVATLPVVRGESVVMRILDKERVVADLDRLGMEAADRALLETLDHSAPRRGAGHRARPAPARRPPSTRRLTEINTPDRTLITIEDPVEYELEGVKQMQVNAAAGVTFVGGLRSMIRNDPDVLMVGEIRDRETAQTRSSPPSPDTSCSPPSTPTTRRWRPPA